MLAVTETTIELDDQPVFLRRAGNDECRSCSCTGSRRARSTGSLRCALGGGIAVDLPGFGQSGKRGDLDYSLAGHVRFLGRLLDELEIDRVRLCMHDWGAAVGLAWAAAQPERVQRLVVVNGIPLLQGFRWRGPARLVRMPFVGAIAIGSATKPILRPPVTARVGERRPDARAVRGKRRRVLRPRHGARDAQAAAAAPPRPRSRRRAGSSAP